MLEYIDNGTELGWLIDRNSQQVEIYRHNKAVEVIQSPSSRSGENILPGFVLKFDRIW